MVRRADIVQSSLSNMALSRNLFGNKMSNLKFGEPNIKLGIANRKDFFKWGNASETM